MSAQQRSLLSLLGFMAVAGAVGLYAYFGVMKPEEAQQEQKAVDDKLFAAYPAGTKGQDGGAPPPAEFSHLTVTAKGETTVLQRQPDGTWRITSPLQTGVDQFVVDGVINQLRDGKVEEKIEETPTDADLQRYGLKDPQFTVHAVAEVPNPADPNAPKTRKEVRIHGGIENTFNGSVYLRREGDPAAYLAPGSIRYSLEKTTFDFRDKQALAVDEERVQRLDVVRPRGQGFSVERGDGPNVWKLVKPRDLEADGPGITTLLGQVKGERATAYLADSPEERKKVGMDAPAVDATLTLKNGEKIRIRVGKATGADGMEKIFALREDEKGAVLAEMQPSLLTALEKSADDLRDKAVLKFQREDVAEIQIRPAGGGAPIVVRKDAPPPPAEDGGTPPPETWTVTAPEKGPAKVWKISSVLWTLSSLQASAFGEEKPKSWAKYGIDDKARQAVLLGADGQVLAHLWIGGEVNGKTNTVHVRGSREQVLEMDSGRLADLPGVLDDVLDRTALFTPDAGTGADAGTP
jgi:hypothetical protein